MKLKCLNCGEMFEDNYTYINEDNKRIWCNSCVSILYKKWKKENIKEV